MRSRAKDHRPKVISFRSTLDGLDIAAKLSVLWPCHAFNISIPQKKKSGLNVFEETILKITEVESGDTEKMALVTCLEKELVVFIQNRLSQLGLLSARYELSDEGKRLLESWRNKDEASIEYAAGTIFVDLFSGTLLPYIHTGTLKQERVTSIEKYYVTVEFGSTGKSKSLRCRLITPSANSFWKAVPNSNDIIRAAREFRKKFNQHVLLNQDVDQYPPPVPMAEAISLHENPELVYLHCNVLIQVGSSELLVTDGCGFGFSESFAQYLTSQNYDWLIDLKKKGLIEKTDKIGEANNQHARQSARYQQISSRIKKSKSSLQEIKNLTVASTHDERKFKNNIEMSSPSSFGGFLPF